MLSKRCACLLHLDNMILFVAYIMRALRLPSTPSSFIVGAPWLMPMSKTIVATILFALLLLVHPTNADKVTDYNQPISYIRPRIL